MEEGATILVEYNQGFSYDNSEISGFYVCCINYSECDTRDAWQRMERSRAKRNSATFIELNLKEICGYDKPTGLAYLWEDIPTKRFMGLPIYGNDNFSLPAAPWKTDVTLFVED